MPVLQKSISRHSNIAVVLVQEGGVVRYRQKLFFGGTQHPLVQVNVDNSITEGEEKRKIVASSCIGPGLSSESENTPLLY